MKGDRLNKIRERLESSLGAKASTTLLALLREEVPEVPIEYSLNTLFNFVIQILATKRTKVMSTHVRGDGWLLNMYSMLFLSSGTGKDTLYDYVTNTLGGYVKRQITEKYNRSYVEIFSNIATEAAEKFPDNEGLQKAWIKNNLPYEYYPFRVAKGTQEGIYEARKSFAQFSFGGVHFFNGEFADYYKSRNDKNKEFLDAMIDTYYGNNDTVLIKSDKSVRATRGIPMTMYVHSANLSFINDDIDTKEKLLAMLSGGMARRMYVVIANPIEENFDLDDIDEIETKRLQKLEDGNKYEDVVKGYFKEMYDFIGKTMQPRYTLTPEADKEITRYRLRLKKTQHKPFQEYIKAEIKGRWEKVVKLACALSVFEDPTDLNVSAEYVKSAIEIVDVYGEMYQHYFLSVEESGHKTLKNKLMENIGKWFTKTDISDMKLHYGNFSKWIFEAESFIESSLYESGHTLEAEQLGSRGRRYRIVNDEQRQLEAEEKILDKLKNKS